MGSVRKRVKEYLIGDYYIIIGKNRDIWQVLPILYSNNYCFSYLNNIIIINLNLSDEKL